MIFSCTTIIATNRGISIKLELNLKNNSIDKYCEINQVVKRYTQLFEINKLVKGKDSLTITIENTNVDVIVTDESKLNANDYLLAII